jgi:Holliday junction resolvasome RuvABC ATP-dependent DNA helicase subunit
LCYELGIRPLGLTPLEIQVLRTLQQHKETSLTRLSAVTGMTKDSLQKDVEMFLQKQDLMQITTSGRALTGKGIEYLKMIDGGAIA